jgi:ABC-type branched-subunit amino acid transport system substrate-binding protein
MLKRAIGQAVWISIIVIIIIIVAVGGYAAVVLSKSSTTTSPTTAPTTTSSTVGPNVTIGMTLSQEGTYAPLDSGYIFFNEAWQNYVNSQGGLVDANGQHHLVKVISGDDGSQAATADTLYTQYATSGANVLISPYSADIGLSLLPIAQQYKVPIIMAEASTRQMWNGSWTWATTDMVPYWSNDTTNAWSASYFALLNQTKWAKSIGFVGWDIAWAVDDYTSSIYLAQHTTGLNVVYEALLQAGTTSFSAQISALKTANNGKPPDIIYCAIFGPVCASFIVQAEQQGLVPKQWHTIEWGASFASTLQQAGISDENITTDVFWTPSFPSSNSGTSTFDTLLQNANSLAVSAGKTPVTWYNYQNIELRMIIFQMIQAAVSKIPSANFSSTSAENSAINYELHHLSIQTIAGQLVVQPQGYGTIGLVTVQFQHNDVETVYPSDVANATYIHP